MSPPDEKVSYDVLFHAHLDACERCRTQPFNLCRFGNSLLRLSGAELVAEHLQDKHLCKQASKAGPQ